MRGVETGSGRQREWDGRALVVALIAFFVAFLILTIAVMASRPEGGHGQQGPPGENEAQRLDA